MRLGISSFTYSWAVALPPGSPGRLGPADLLARARALGVGVAQLGDNAPLQGLSAADLGDLAAAAAGVRVHVEVGMRGLVPDLVGRYVEIAAALGSPVLRLVTDSAEAQPSADEIVAVLRGLVPRLQAAGVVLALENHDRFPSAQLREMLDRVGSPSVGLCLDTVNSLVALEDPRTVVETLAGYTVSLHLKDVRARRDASGLGVVIQGVPAGEGQVDIPWVIGRVRAAGRDPNAILEQWTPAAGDTAATLAREAAWAEQSVAYLRTLIPD
jgi:3-oxoisoapionate decarboxylase